MKAIVKKEPKVGLWLEEVPEPKPLDNEVLIKVKKTSICGTDVHIYQWDDWAKKTIRTPVVVGHEFMGEIAEVGRNVKKLKVGMRVSGEGHLTCGSCAGCQSSMRHLCSKTLGVGIQRHGCFAEYFTLPAENIFPIPDSVSDDLAAIFDPFGNAMHTAGSFNLLGEDVLVTGAGPIGIMSAAIAKRAGARNVVVTDLNDYRLNLTRKMGITSGINIAKTSLETVLETIGIFEGFSVGFEMSGSPTALSTILELARPGAKIALLGILPQNTVIDWDLIIFKLLTVKGIYGREIFTTWRQMVSLLEGGLDLTPMITHHFDYSEFQQGIDVMIAGQCGKVILNWN